MTPTSARICYRKHAKARHQRAGRGGDVVLYQIDIEKRKSEEYWTNVYIVNVVDEAAARDAGLALVARERLQHRGDVSFTHYRVRQRNQTAVPGVKLVAGGVGALASNVSFNMPLFCVLRVDMISSDRSVSRKYYRFPLQTNDQADGTLTAAQQTAYQNWANATLAAVPSLCDPQGNAITTMIVAPAVGMRQLRRASKRKLPVL